jgi:uncharacterized protein (DUF2126 family)
MIEFKAGTHKQIVYDYLRIQGNLTTRKAMIECGIMDLQGVIRDLRKEGVDIATEYIKVETRYTKNNGEMKYAHVKEYSLKIYDYKTPEEYAEWDFDC